MMIGSNKNSYGFPAAVLAMGLVVGFADAAVPVLPGSNHLSLKAQLGQQLFFDEGLSTPPGQSCASCHNPKVHFVDPNSGVPTSAGVVPTLKGSRNTPTVAYASHTPNFYYDREDGLYKGGLFMDGRAPSLANQAKKPFLNPIEMANPDAFTVVEKVRASRYAKLFNRVYGARAFDNAPKAFGQIAEALATFEQSAVFNRFNSKYDYFLAGKAKFTDQEKRGRKLFEDSGKGNCAACHPSRPAPDGTPPLFTDFSYDNLGVPRNPENPFYRLGAEFNPLGWGFIDKGLGGFLGERAEEGKFKVPSLRNIAKTGPYMHNGYFKSLRGVVAFYARRDIWPVCQTAFVADTQALKSGCWPVPEVRQNVNVAELGELNLSDAEMDDIVAFLQTLTDGYQPNP